MNSKSIIDPNVKYKTAKFIGENIGQNVSDFGFAKI